MIKVCLIGLGKTGKEIAKALMTLDDIKLVSVICSPDSSKQGMDLGEILGTKDTGITIESSKSLEHVVFRTKPDVVIDFSSPKATISNAKILSRLRVNMVVGTTGFSQIGLKKLMILTRKYHNAIIYAPNITLGVNVLMLLTNLASNILNSYDFQITEIHHKQKKDSPSGTALKIAREIKSGLRLAGKEVEQENIPIVAIRAGGLVGKHEVMIVGEDDKIEISHEAFSRKAFAAGAIQAVRFITGKSGYYEMSDVLNMKKVLSDYVQRETEMQNKRYLNSSGNLKKLQQLQN